VKVKIEELKKLAQRAIKKYGYTDEEGKAILEILMYAQLRGNNQGLVKLIGRGIPKDKEVGEIKVIKETKLSALLDGGRNMGMLVMKKAMKIALEKTKEHGFGIVGTKNTCSSTGAIGYYVREIARQDYLGFAFAGSPCFVCHYGSSEAKYGTNPIAVGVPTEDDPIVLDMATAAMAWFGLVEAKTAGQSIPGDVAYDNQGQLTADPAKAMEGAIRPFDRSYKGAGLAMMVEILTGPLVDASFVGLGEKNNWGNLIFAIDPELLGDREEFKNKIFQLIENVKASKKLPGVENIFVPGERGNRLTQERLNSGKIEIEDNLYQAIKKVVEED